MRNRYVRTESESKKIIVPLLPLRDIICFPTWWPLFSWGGNGRSRPSSQHGKGPEDPFRPPEGGQDRTIPGKRTFTASERWARPFSAEASRRDGEGPGRRGAPGTDPAVSANTSLSTWSKWKRSRALPADASRQKPWCGAWSHVFEIYAKFNQRIAPEVVDSLRRSEDPEPPGRCDGGPYRLKLEDKQRLLEIRAPRKQGSRNSTGFSRPRSRSSRWSRRSGTGSRSRWRRIRRNTT